MRRCHIRLVARGLLSQNRISMVCFSPLVFDHLLPPDARRTFVFKGMRGGRQECVGDVAGCCKGVSVGFARSTGRPAEIQSNRSATLRGVGGFGWSLKMSTHFLSVWARGRARFFR
jgi:hypothetical protein